MAGCLSDIGFMKLYNCVDYKLCVTNFLVNLWLTIVESFHMVIARNPVVSIVVAYPLKKNPEENSIVGPNVNS